MSVIDFSIYYENNKFIYIYFSIISFYKTNADLVFMYFSSSLKLVRSGLSTYWEKGSIYYSIYLSLEIGSIYYPIEVISSLINSLISY